jgi:selenophosphate synthase
VLLLENINAKITAGPRCCWKTSRKSGCGVGVKLAKPQPIMKMEPKGVTPRERVIFLDKVEHNQSCKIMCTFPLHILALDNLQ